MHFLFFLQIVRVRETLVQNLQDKRAPEVGTSESQISNDSGAAADIIIPVVNTTRGNNTSSQKDISLNNVDTGRREKEIQEDGSSESKEIGAERSTASSYNNQKQQCGNVEYVSFSDLENEYNNMSVRLSAASGGRVSSGSESSGWVGIPKAGLSSTATPTTTTVHDKHHYESEESSDWFPVVDDDVDSDSFSVV